MTKKIRLVRVRKDFVVLKCCNEMLCTFKNNKVKFFTKDQKIKIKCLQILNEEGYIGIRLMKILINQ